MNFGFDGSLKCSVLVSKKSICWLACAKFTWMNHKNENVTCMDEINTTKACRTRKSERKRERIRNVNDETDTIRTGSPGLV